jgi:signal peptidase I
MAARFYSPASLMLARAFVLVAFGVVLLACGSASRSSNGALPVQTITLPTRTVTYSVPSSSMEPTLHCARPGSECEGVTADGAVTQEPVRDIKREDVVVFRTPALAEVRCGAGGTFIKRVIGLPGDRWEERSGFVYINGKKLDEPYVKTDRRDSRTIAPTAIPPASYFVMGDNRVSSCDSRAWGTVPAANLIGKVIKIVRSG